jgi:putative transposase
MTRLPRQKPQSRSIEIIPQQNRSRHGKPPSTDNQTAADPGIPQRVTPSGTWYYLAVVLDLFTRKIVGWAMRDHMRAELTIAALRQKPPPGLIHHSDRGSQYAAANYRKVLGACRDDPIHEPEGKLAGL